MKKNFTITLILLLLIAIGFSGWVFKNNEEEKEKEALYKEYKGIAHVLHLDIDENVYVQTGNPKDLVLASTDITFKLLDRWKFISENFSEVEYPDEVIEEENWVEVQHTLDEQTYPMEEVSNKIWEEFADNGDGNHSMAVYDYIYDNEVVTDYFRRFLEENEVE